MHSSALYQGSRQRGSVLLIVLLLLWAMSYYLLAGMQALNHQNQWLLALSNNAQHYTEARIALTHAIRRIETGQRSPAPTSFVVEKKNVITEQNNALYLLSLRRQNGAAAKDADQFMQVAYGRGVRAMWLP